MFNSHVDYVAFCINVKIDIFAYLLSTLGHKFGDVLLRRHFLLKTNRVELGENMFQVLAREFPLKRLGRFFIKRLKIKDGPFQLLEAIEIVGR